MAQDKYNLDELRTDFTLTPDFGVIKAGMKENGGSSNDLWKIQRSVLRPVEGYNVRVKNPAYWVRVRRYADSMKLNGYMSTKPMTGFMGRDPVTGENVVYYTAGYTRIDAFDLANRELLAEGKKPLEFVTIVLLDKSITSSQLNAMLITENEAAALSPFEAAIVCKRMLEAGESVEEIAKAVNFSTEWVDSLLALGSSPQELQLMVIDDIVTATFAIDTIKAHGEQALTILKDALARKMGDAGADSTGGDEDPATPAKKVRVTAKDLVKPEVRRFQNAMKREAPVMYTTLTNVTKDPAFDSLAPETRETVLGLMEKLKKHEAEDGDPGVDARQAPLFQGDAETRAPADSTSTDAESA
jgi:ParB family chromosome partitioning protein